MIYDFICHNIICHKNSVKKTTQERSHESIAALPTLSPSKSFYAHEGPSKTDFVVPIVPKSGSETAEVCRNFSCRTVWISEAGWMIHSYFIAEVQL